MSKGLDKFRTILGVRFFTGTAGESLDKVRSGGLLVVPAAPALKDLPSNLGYREALLCSDVAITDSFFMVLIWKPNWYLTYHYWPVAPDEHVFEGTLYFVPAKNARERVAHENAAVTFKEFGLQDANTLEATQTMLESRVIERFPLMDQEVLVRHMHKVARDWVDEYKKKQDVEV